MKFDVALVDLGLPDSQGIETLRRLRAAAPDMPTIVVSGQQDAGTARQALVCGAQDFIFKQELHGVRLAKAIVYAIERHRLTVERHRSEETLKTSQSQLMRALEAGGMGTWAWDIAQDRWTWNEASLLMWERTATQLGGVKLDTLISFVMPQFRDRVGSTLRTIRDGVRSDVALEFCVEHEGREGNWLLLKGALETSEEGTPARMSGICMDISTRARSEELLRRSQKLEALGTLAGGIAHDFNNILLAIAANASEAAQDLPADHPVSANIAEIRQSSSRAMDLVRHILAFSRPVEKSRVEVRLASVIEEALKLTRAILPAMVEIRSQFAADTPVILGDASEIHQILVNLVTNAGQAVGRRQGLVDVRLDRIVVSAQPVGDADLAVGEYARLRVTDDGAGMDKITVKRIFDPFFTTKGPSEGTGLGLSVVHGILRSHGGSIHVYSELGKGTTFTLYFPAVQRVDAQKPAPIAEVAPTQGQGERVLYVDDDPALQFIVPRLLKRLGYVVTTFSDARKAADAVRADSMGFDIVVTDVMMPAMSGFEFAEALLAIRPDLPILMMSGHVRVEDEDRARQLGVRQIMHKADSMGSMSSELSVLLARHVAKPTAAGANPAP
jgi:signal transduction histidine kinase